MKNKKLLNIFILLLSLLTLIADILLFAFPAYGTNTSTVFEVIFWIANSLTLLCLIAAILITLVALFMDDYVCSKMTETFVLIAFVMTLINTLTFALSGYSLSFLYMLVVVLTFLTSTISQILRLIASTKTWKADFKALVKTHKPQVTIDASKDNEDSSNEENGDPVKFNLDTEE